MKKRANTGGEDVGQVQEHDPQLDDESPGVDQPNADVSGDGGREGPLTDSRERFGARWNEIQAGFVDEPRRAVEDADRLVEEVIEHVTRTAADERQRVASQLSSSEVDTEGLRVALQRLRQLYGSLVR